jgi:hypothetical protein
LQWNGTIWVCATISGGGTITGVTAGTDLTGGGTTGKVTLNLDITKVPQLAAANTFTNNQAVSASSVNPALGISNSGSGDGIDISSVGGAGLMASSSGNIGVSGSSISDSDFAAATVGFEFGPTRQTLGLYGFTASPAGAGVYGQAVTGSVIAGTFTQRGGVWGDTGNAGEAAVVASGDDDFGLFAVNNSPTLITIWGENASSDGTSLVFEAFESNRLFRGSCAIDVRGNLGCTGSKSAVVPVESGTRKVALYAVEAPENWFEDFGSGALSGGVAAIVLEPTFAQTVNTGIEYHVFVTAKGDCKGLYVANETAAGFEVHELGGGQSNVGFDYRIVARRKGYENIRLADKTKQFEPPKLHRVNAPGRKAPVPVKPARPGAAKLAVAEVQPVATHK